MQIKVTLKGGDDEARRRAYAKIEAALSGNFADPTGGVVTEGKRKLKAKAKLDGRSFGD